jgi:hypothetical protein
MKRRLLVVIAALAVILALAPPASAIKYGQPDGNRHPWVGLMVAFEDGQPLWRCTGSLINSTTFLTAGHCTGTDGEGTVPDHVEIWFEPGPIPTDPNYKGSCSGVTGYPCQGDVGGTPVPMPGWNGALTVPNTHDVGLVVLDEPYVLSEYGQVAPVGYLDTLATKRGQQDVTFTVVGYGLQSVKPVESAVKQRMMATVKLISLRSALTDGYNVQYTSNPGQGRGGPGGTCFGDSGGPVIHNGYIVAVNSFVMNLNCAGTGYGFRVDTQPVHNFINQYSSVPV